MFNNLHKCLTQYFDSPQLTPGTPGSVGIINGGCSIERSALGALDTWHTAAGGRTLSTLGTLGHLSPLLASRSRELGPATHHI